MNHEVGIMNYGKKGKIKSFTDLDIWKEGHKLVLMIYSVTKTFPKEEQFGLTNQIRRAVISVTSNIAEGFSRISYKDKAHFYVMSLGSLTELQNQILIARDVKYVTPKVFNGIAEKTVSINKMTNGFIKSSKAVIRAS
jgi:four helix bundle protein